MKIYIDESGDPGFKFESGSSSFFTIAMIIFKDNSEAMLCDKDISNLKSKLGWKESDEFHFKRNSDKIRLKFIKFVLKFDFEYYVVIIDKISTKYKAKKFHNKDSLYGYAYATALTNLRTRIINADIIIDESGSKDFLNKLSKHLRKLINTDKIRIRKIKMERSRSNNLLQLADYIAGILNRSIANGEYESDEFRKRLKSKETKVEII